MVYFKKMPRKSSTLPTKKADTQHVAVMNPRPSFFQIMKEGLVFGVGSSIGHRIVGAILNPVQNTVNKNEEYEQCMKKHDDRSVCQEILQT